MGQEAWQMIGRTPGYIVAVRPLRGGAITDFEITERMIRLLLQRVGYGGEPDPRQRQAMDRKSGAAHRPGSGARWFQDPRGRR